MDTKTIFVLTPKGEEEVAHKTSLLYGDIKRALSMIDGVSTFAEISKRAAPSLRTILAELVKELLNGGFIQDKSRVGFSAKIVVPPKAPSAAPVTQAPKQEQADSELDFTTIMRAPSADILRAEAAKVQAEQLAKQHAEQQKLKIEQEAAKAKQLAEAENVRKAEEHAARVKAVAAAEAKAKQEAEEKARKEAEEKARKEAEEKARKEAEEKARKEAEEKARKEAEEKARKEAEEKARKEAEEKARKEAEEKARKEAEEKARKEAEEKAKLEAESKARAQAEFARLRAEQEAEKVRKDAELARQKAEADAAKSREEAERIKKDAELAAAKAKEEVERIKKEAEAAAAKAKAEAERIKLEAEVHAKAQEEATRKAQAEADAARLKAEAEAARVREELEAARLKVEQEEIARAEAETARLAAEHIAAQALVAAEQQKLQELEKQSLQAIEEEKIRAKRHALAAASTQVRDTPYDTSKPPALKLDAINLDALEIKPDPSVASKSVSKEKAKVALEQGPSAEELKAKEDALKLQAKKAEEARLAEEAAAKKLADAQAKAWAEAEQRAAQAAKSHVEHLAQQSAQNAHAKQQQDQKLQAVLKRRKPFPWRSVAAAVVVLVVLAVFIVPMLLNTRNYADQLESQLSAKLKQPVHIGKMSVRILPSPRVQLGEIYIGDVKQIKAQQALLDFGFGALFGSVKRVNKLELQGAELNDTGLLSVPNWVEQMAADARYPISQIVFTDLKLSAEAVQLNDISGSLNFSPTGKIESSVLQAMGGKYALDVKAVSDGKYATTVNLRKAALPLLPNWNFDELTAKGELSRDGLVLTEFDSRIAGGALQGDAKLGWKNGWSMQGTLNAKSVALTNLNRLLEGDMDGEGRYKFQADSLIKLADSVSLDGTFVVKKGLFNGVDIVETARLHSKEHLPGGRTHFDKMESNLLYSGNAYHFKSIKLGNSVMNVTGNVDVAKQQLSGRLSARLSITEGMGSVDLQLGGATDNPTLRALR